MNVDNGCMGRKMEGWMDVEVCMESALKEDRLIMDGWINRWMNLKLMWIKDVWDEKMHKSIAGRIMDG